MKQNCKGCGKEGCKKKQIEIMQQWGYNQPGKLLFECMVGVGATEILISRGVARYKKSASKKTNKPVSDGSKPRRSKRSSED